MSTHGRWIRITRDLREAIECEARSCTCGAARHESAKHVVGLYDRARAEDWIAQLTEINRKLLEENNELQTHLDLANGALHRESA